MDNQSPAVIAETYGALWADEVDPALVWRALRDLPYHNVAVALEALHRQGVRSPSLGRVRQQVAVAAGLYPANRIEAALELDALLHRRDVPVSMASTVAWDTIDPDYLPSGRDWWDMVRQWGEARAAEPYSDWATNPNREPAGHAEVLHPDGTVERIPTDRLGRVIEED